MTTRPTTTTSIAVIKSAIREPSEDEWAKYLLMATLGLSETDFSVTALDTEIYGLMLQDGAIGACTAIEAGRNLQGAMGYAISTLPSEVPDPLEASGGFSLVLALVTSGVDAFCPGLSFNADAIELTNAWSALTGGAIIDPETIIEDGVWVVGEDVQPGTYRNSGGDGCYWERLSGFGGTSSDLIANGFSEDPQIVTIAASDAGFSSDGCGIWTLQE